MKPHLSSYCLVPALTSGSLVSLYWVSSRDCPAFLDRNRNNIWVSELWLGFSKLSSPSLRHGLLSISVSAVFPSESESTPHPPPQSPAHTHRYPLICLFRGFDSDCLVATEAGTMTERGGGEWVGPGNDRRLESERATEWGVSCYKRECWSCQRH